ncbi:MAG: NAD(P)H-hydrate dehydratase [Candidatus Syntropharchaeia archaeon]
MEECITSKEMATLDENCKFFGLSTLQLMENAGSSIAQAIKSRFSGGRIVIIAGRGNNGGDAFVAARHLRDFDVEVILLGSSGDIRTEEARKNWKILEEARFNLREIRDSSEIDGIRDSLRNADIIIDGIFGTGIRGEIRDPESTVIDLINESKAFVLSVDIPSGVDPDTGSFHKAVNADLTVTFHRMKPGLVKYPNKVEIADIGIPLFFEMLVGPGDVKAILRRDPGSHKGENGRILIVGGGPFVGAPALSALSALRCGADWVTIACPKNISPIVSSFSPNLIVKPLSSDILNENDVPFIIDLMKKHDVLVIGMGLGNADETVEAVKSIIKESKKAVIDADGLYGVELPAKKGIIITPHAGELSKMGDIVLPDGLEERIIFLKEFSKKNNLVTLMKGREDIISDGEKVKINRTGNAGMTVGGTGDVLSGIVGAFYAITDNPFLAASAGAFVSGSAGDLAFVEGGYGLLATDVLENIPKVLKNKMERLL